MGIFDFRKRDDPTAPTPQPTTDPVTPVSDVLLEALLNSQPITKEQALSIPAVAGAVDFISSMIASMPVKLYKYKDGKVESKDDDPRVGLLNGDTGDVLNAYEMKKNMVEDYLLSDRGGNCYIRRDRNNVTGLFYVNELHVSLIPNFKPIYKDYQILVLGDPYKPYDFIRLVRNSKDGALGRGVTCEVGKALETAYNTLLYQLNMVKSGGNKKGFLKAQRKLGQEEINTLKNAWKRLYANDTENVVVLNNGLEFQEASNNAVENQLNEGKKTLHDEINNIFHIIPDDFYETFKQAIYPITRAFATALNKDLLLEKEKGKMFFDFDVKEIIKANVKERFEAYKIAKETGWMSLNEIRREENRNHIDGLDCVNVGLGAVLYDFNTHKFYTPNTDTVADPNDGVDTATDEAIDNLLTDKTLDQEFEQDGNSSDG